ncbi:MAG TPA: septal ring lytic transglycosylase RlpA family protein [Actinomycetota bacterium]|nr:septal ring lytic transglycosylase RlpA family protein [Actinomycetota bacterium]
MRLRALSARGAGALLILTAVLGLTASPVAARPHMSEQMSEQTEAPPEPVLDRAPGIVDFRKPIVIKGHLERGYEGDYVALERRWPRENDWEAIRTKRVDEELKVRFELEHPRSSAHYRLMWTDGQVDQATYSDSVRIGVRARITLHFNPSRIYSGREVKAWGSLRPFHRGRRFVLQTFAGWGWRTLAKLHAPEGKFVARFRSGSPGRRAYRVLFRGDHWNAPEVSSAPLYAYDPDLATWYGPGLYGNGTACGQTLTPGTEGVAHRTLPCGTMVSVYFQGRSVTVPVIDRGPYSGAEWDLTQATAERLGFSGSQTIGTIH